MDLGDMECYEPDELPTALSRDLDCKDTIVFKFCKVFLYIILKNNNPFFNQTQKQHLVATFGVC